MSILIKKPEKLGLYIHIPFCSFLCHYCDFNKTARWSEEDLSNYCKALEKHFNLWVESSFLKDKKFSSLNFGGGTPSLLSDHYKELFKTLQERLTSTCEISIEANPNDLNERKLKIWQELGFNRIYLGVQSFREHGLKFLKRDHNVEKAVSAIKLAKKFFDKVNIDLIYNWPEQEISDWNFELKQALSLKPSSLSLYNLTYAAKTPIGRMKERGRIQEKSSDTQALFYEKACEILKKEGFIHDEVSNWSKPGYDCQHNQLYWQNKYYLGIGTGACGYLPEKEGFIGFRYQYTNSLKSFLAQESLSTHFSLERIKDLKYLDIKVDKRDEQSWLLEVLACGLRSKTGVCLKHIEEVGGFIWNPKQNIKEAFEKGMLKIEKNRIILVPQEWFRETSWCLLLSECFLLKKKKQKVCGL